MHDDATPQELPKVAPRHEHYFMRLCLTRDMDRSQIARTFSMATGIAEQDVVVFERAFGLLPEAVHGATGLTVEVIPRAGDVRIELEIGLPNYEERLAASAPQFAPFHVAYCVCKASGGDVVLDYAIDGGWGLSLVTPQGQAKSVQIMDRDVDDEIVELRIYEKDDGDAASKNI